MPSTKTIICGEAWTNESTQLSFLPFMLYVATTNPLAPNYFIDRMERNVLLLARLSCIIILT